MIALAGVTRVPRREAKEMLKWYWKSGGPVSERSKVMSNMQSIMLTFEDEGGARVDAHIGEGDYRALIFATKFSETRVTLVLSPEQWENIVPQVAKAVDNAKKAHRNR